MTTETETTETPRNDGQLGWIVSWRVPAEIELDKLRSALASSGLDPELAGDMRNEHALRRALRDMNESRVIRKLRRDEACVYFQLTHEYLGEHEISYAKEAEVCLTTETGLVTCDDAAIGQQARTLLQEHLNKRMTTDLTRLVQSVFDAEKAALVPIREQGGAYFVPETHSELVDKSRQFLDAIGGKLRSFAVRLGSGDTSASVADSMADYFLDLVKEFRASCEGLHTETRGDVRGRRIQAISEMKAKLDCYRGLLSGLAGQIGNQLEEAEGEMLVALMRPAPVEEEVLSTDDVLVGAS